jgi:hypothetical protein
MQVICEHVGVIEGNIKRNHSEWENGKAKLLKVETE